MINSAGFFFKYLHYKVYENHFIFKKDGLSGNVVLDPSMLFGIN